MADNLNKWLKYGKAKLDDLLASGNKELDRREAELEVERADKPWLSAEGEGPTFDSTKARIEWELEQQQRQAEERASAATADGQTPEATKSDVPDEPATSPQAAASDGKSDPPLHDRFDQLDATEQATAKLELEERQRASEERLAEIRRELGVEEPPPAP